MSELQFSFDDDLIVIENDDLTVSSEYKIILVKYVKPVYINVPFE